MVDYMEPDTKDAVPLRTEKDISTDKGEIPLLERRLALSTETKKREIYIALIAKFISLLAIDRTKNPEYRKEEKKGFEFLADQLLDDFKKLNITQPVIIPSRYLDEPVFNVKVGQTKHTFFSGSQSDDGFKQSNEQADKIDNHQLSAFYIRCRMECCRYRLYDPDENFADGGSDLKKWMDMLDDGPEE